MNYHTGANVKAGKGDHCKMIGKTGAQMQAMSEAEVDAYDSGWRLPTDAEQALFIGVEPILPNNNKYTISNAKDNTFNSGYTVGTNGFLPAAGFINTNASDGTQNIMGTYLSNSPASNVIKYPRRLEFGSGVVYYINSSDYRADAFSVRCVQDL